MNVFDQALHVAIEARSRAHAPYSGFKVGAVVKAVGDDRLFAGCNVENASYGATICAERSAIVHMISVRGAATIEYVLVVTEVSPPSVPCALCLQVLAEFTTPDTLVHLADLHAVRRTVRMCDLLPEPFVLV